MAANLDDILNDALNDFDFEDNTKASINTTPSAAPSATPEASPNSAPAPNLPSAPPSAPSFEPPNEGDTSAWAEEFFQKMASDDPEVKRMMEELQAAVASMPNPADGTSSPSGSSVPLPDMPNIDLQNPEMESRLEALQKMLAEVEGGNDSEEVLDKILEAAGMSDMMQQLMSKDILLEPFRDMDKQYGVWFKSNAETVSSEDKSRYIKQHEIVKKIITVYETQDQSTDIVAGLISEMQALGDPPHGMIQDIFPDFKFDADGKPQMP